MNTESKAKELVEKFSPLVTTWDCYHDCPENPDNILKDAKQCALIAVEEILINLHWMEDSINADKAISFWQSVKEAINKI